MVIVYAHSFSLSKSKQDKKCLFNRFVFRYRNEFLFDKNITENHKIKCVVTQLGRMIIIFRILFPDSQSDLFATAPKKKEKNASVK